MRVKPNRIVKKLKQYNVNYALVKGWDSPVIDPYGGRSDFHGIVLHHTAGTNSLKYIVSGNPYAPVRACHFYVARGGKVHVVSGSGAYHAGSGGPWKFARKVKSIVIPRDQGNSHLWGIEIESLGKTAAIDGTTAGMTKHQVVSTAMLCAALMDAGSPAMTVWPVSRVIRHRDWAPGRKPDVLQDLGWWRTAIGIARKYRNDPDRAKALILKFVEEYPKGKL